MTDRATPPVPELSSEWIVGRRAQLVDELAQPHLKRPSTRVAVGGAGAVCTVAAAIAVLVLTLAGPGAQSAFAGWSATPTQAPSGQTAAAESACAAKGLSIDDRDATPERGAQPVESSPPLPTVVADEWHTVLADARGPFIMVILEADEGRANTSCLFGPAPSGAPPSPSATYGDLYLLRGSGGFEFKAPAAAPDDQVRISISQTSAIGKGRYGAQPYSYVEGRTGANVTGVAVVLENGTHVEATSSNEWFLAWWPSAQQAVEAEVTTNSGVSTQQLGSEG
jgi:hypothetical protein